MPQYVFNFYASYSIIIENIKVYICPLPVRTISEFPLIAFQQRSHPESYPGTHFVPNDFNKLAYYTKRTNLTNVEIEISG